MLRATKKDVFDMMKESNLIMLFGNNPFVRILDAFMDNMGEDYSKKEIQELAGISKGALFQHWNKLERFNLIKVTRSFENTKLYTLDAQSKTIKELLKLEMCLIEATTPKENIEKAEKIKAIA